MSEQKRPAPISEKEEEKREEVEVDDDDASEQDMQIEVSKTTKAITTSQKNAIKPVVKEDNNNYYNTTTRITTAAAADFHLMTQEEDDLMIKVRNAGDALYDLVLSAIEKAKTISAQKVKELATRDISPAAIAAKKDAHDIAALGESVESLASTFERLMTEMRKQPYPEQVHLLRGYKKLLKEQINVIDSRINMAKRLIK
jgi:biopolymer transport protein ExbD